MSRSGRKGPRRLVDVFVSARRAGPRLVRLSRNGTVCGLGRATSPGTPALASRSATIGQELRSHRLHGGATSPHRSRSRPESSSQCSQQRGSDAAHGLCDPWPGWHLHDPGILPSARGCPVAGRISRSGRDSRGAAKGSSLGESARERERFPTSGGARRCVSSSPGPGVPRSGNLPLA